MPLEKPTKKIIDWDSIYKEYRANQISNVQIGKKYGVTEGAIRKKAKELNWKKDLDAEVRKQVRESLVRQQVRESTISDSEIIDTAVKTNIEIIRGHRKKLAEGLRITSSLFEQLEIISNNREVLENLIFSLTEGDPTKDEKPDYKERAKLIKAISLPSHAGAARDLTTALKNIIPLERQAFNLDEEDITDKDVFIAILSALPEQIRQQITELVKGKLKNKS